MTNNFENTRQNTEEVKNMTSVRKASELKSLDELNLSKRTYNSVKNIPLERLIYLVRRGKYEYRIDRMWRSSYEELDRAIEEAGFIRHDFDGRSFGLGALYRTIIEDHGDSQTLWPYVRLSGFESNEAYESYKNFSEAQLEAVDQLLDEVLNEEEKDILRLRFGLADGKRWNLTEVGAKYNCTRDRARAIEARAMFKLRSRSRSNRLKAIVLFSSEEQCRDQITSMCHELTKLYKESRELKEKIFAVKKYSPFFSEEKRPDSTELDQSRQIEVLNLSVRTYKILRCAGIATIDDLERLRSADPENWHSKIRRIDRSAIRELVEKTNRFLGWEKPLIDKF